MLFLFFNGFIGNFYAQDSSKNLRGKALSAMEKEDWLSAAYYEEMYLKAKPKDVKTRISLADNYRKARNYSASEAQYKIGIESGEKIPLLAKFNYALMLKMNGKCEEAIPIFDEFRKAYSGEKEDAKYIRLAKNNIEGCKRIEEVEKSKNIFVEPLSNKINGENMEGAPIFLNESELIFSSLRKGTDSTIQSRQFYYAKKVGQDFEFQGIWGEELSMPDHELVNGAFNFEQNRFYYSACFTNMLGQVDCDLFVADYNAEKKKLSDPKKLNKEINSKFIESQVAIGKDYKNRELIYFVSDRKDGKGGKDIWYVRYEPNKDKFSGVRNLGSKINTPGDEYSPFINPINRKLYFSSDGQPGMGGLDVFSAKGERSKWEEPEHLPEPINSSYDDLYFSINPSGEEGALVSNRVLVKTSNSCCDDIYHFRYLDHIKVELKGNVSENGTVKNALPETNLELYQWNEDRSEKFLVSTKVSDGSGNFDAILEPNQVYEIHAKKEGYFTKIQAVSSTDFKTNRTIVLNLSLDAISEEAIQIENIYYQFNKSELTDEAKLILDTTIYPILLNNPEIKIELGSHTDNKGAPAYNKSLSLTRAKSVVQYLQKKGIAKNRMVAMGYGETKPVANNSNSDGSDNPEGRAKNRRTEFKVIGKIKLIEKDED